MDVETENEMDAESEQCKEVYARFGLAVYHAQCLEQELENILGYNAIATKTCLTLAELDGIDATNAKKTLGNLFLSIKRSISCDQSVSNLFELCLEHRNHLVHHFFKIHAADLMFREGKDKMLQEIEKISEDLVRGYRTAGVIVGALEKEIGMPPDVLKRAMEQMLAEAKKNVASA